MEPIKIAKPVIVEGRYDKNKLSSILDADIITTDGFGIFKAAEKTSLIRRLAAERGVIVLTDSDGAGLVIRNYFNSILPPGQVTHLYIPQIPGKERRKSAPSKSGMLGVEGIDAELLRRLLEPFADSAPAKRGGRAVTKGDFYADGLSGGEGSREKRDALAQSLDLPRGISANALLAAVNMLIDYERYKEVISDGKNQADF